MPAFPSCAFTRWHHHNNWGSRHPIAAYCMFFSFFDCQLVFSCACFIVYFTFVRLLWSLLLSLLHVRLLHAFLLNTQYSILIYRPRKDERLNWPGWLTCSGWFTHLGGHPSATGRAPDSESTTAKDRRYTAGQRNQPKEERGRRRRRRRRINHRTKI